MSPAEIDEIFKNRKGGSEKEGGEWGALHHMWEQSLQIHKTAETKQIAGC
jgi:hypothetical protein